MSTKTEVDVNKSDKIREYLKSVKPSDRSPTAVAKALKAKGIEVSPAFVSQIKTKINGKKDRKKKAIKSKPKRSKAKAMTPHQSLLNAKDFLNSAGGLSEAKRLLDLVHNLIS